MKITLDEAEYWKLLGDTADASHHSPKELDRILSARAVETIGLKFNHNSHNIHIDAPTICYTKNRKISHGFGPINGQ